MAKNQAIKIGVLKEAELEEAGGLSGCVWTSLDYQIDGLYERP